MALNIAALLGGNNQPGGGAAGGLAAAVQKIQQQKQQQALMQRLQQMSQPSPQAVQQYGANQMGPMPQGQQQPGIVQAAPAQGQQGQDAGVPKSPRPLLLAIMGSGLDEETKHDWANTILTESSRDLAEYHQAQADKQTALNNHLQNRKEDNAEVRTGIEDKRANTMQANADERARHDQKREEQQDAKDAERERYDRERDQIMRDKNLNDKQKADKINARTDAHYKRMDAIAAGRLDVAQTRTAEEDKKLALDAAKADMQQARAHADAILNSQGPKAIKSPEYIEAKKSYMATQQAYESLAKGGASAAKPVDITRDAAPAGQHKVGDIIEAGGKKYRITGGDMSDPDVELVP